MQVNATNNAKTRVNHLQWMQFATLCWFSWFCYCCCCCSCGGFSKTFPMHSVSFYSMWFYYTNFLYCVVASIIASYLFTNFMHNVQSMILIVLCASCSMHGVCACVLPNDKCFSQFSKENLFPDCSTWGIVYWKSTHTIDYFLFVNWTIYLSHFLLLALSVCVVSRSDYPCLSVVYFPSIFVRLHSSFVALFIVHSAHSEKFMNYVWACVLCEVRDSEENFAKFTSI